MNKMQTNAFLRFVFINLQLNLMQVKWLPTTDELYQFRNDGPFCLVSFYGQRVA